MLASYARVHVVAITTDIDGINRASDMENHTAHTTQRRELCGWTSRCTTAYATIATASHHGKSCHNQSIATAYTPYV
jgi:hypothetical protein